MNYLHSFAKGRDLLSIPARLGLMAALLAGLALGLVPPQTAQAQGVIRVTTTGATSGTCGDTWANACDLQYALTTVAVSGDEIWVAQGTYQPTSGTDRAATFQLKNGVALYGGFAGTETSRDQRDWENRTTTLSGDLNGDDDGFTNNGENSYHVVTGGGTDASAVLDGFTVTGGNANEIYDPDNDGGGMYNYQGSPTLSNVTFSGNSANRGGGMYNNYDSSPTLSNVTFSGNSAAYQGGGMRNYDSSPTLSNVTFSGNSAALMGGGMRNYDSSPTLSNCILWGNTASSGPQIRNDGSSSPSVTYSLVQGGYAAGTDIIDADPLFVRNPDPGDGDYGDLRLQAGSPAIDAGNNTAVPADVSVDLAGNPRFIDHPQPDFASGTTPIGTPPIVDLGAYEAVHADLGLAKSATPSTAAPGQALTYTLAFSNTGLFTAIGVAITDIVPISVTTVSYTYDPAGATVTQTNAGVLTYTWEVENLSPGEDGVITLTGVLSQGLPTGHIFTNTAVITSTTGEITTTNNSSSAGVTAGIYIYLYLPIVLKNSVP